MGINTNGKPAASLEEQLKGRTWPEEPKGVILGDYEGSPYVRQGRVFTRALRLHQQVSASIPGGESGVTSLCIGRNGKIYGATSGAKSHLFFYDPAPMGDGVVDIGAVPGVKAIRRGLVAADGNRVFAAASEMLDPAAGGPLFVHDTTIDHSDESRAYKGSIEQLIVPVKGECVAALCGGIESNLFGVSSRTGTFFQYDSAKNKVEQVGPVSKDVAFSKFLVADGSGRVYGTHSLGTLFRFDPAIGKLEDLEIRIPSLAGREFYNALDTAVYEPSSGLIYGAGTADGVLFSFNPETQRIRSLGKAAPEPRVRAMTAAPDGRIFGIAGCEDGMGRLFCLDPKAGELTDLGILMAASEIWRRGFEFDAACTGHNGELYFGENERDGHLFMYFPVPVKQSKYDHSMIPF